MTRTGELTLTVERGFAAPRAAVFRALTDAEEFGQWAGSAEQRLEISKHDARLGGEYRYAFTSGPEQMVMFGVYREFVPNRRVVRTENYEHVEWQLVVATDLEDRGDGTWMTITIEHPTEELCDQTFPGFEANVHPMFQRLADHLAKR